MRIAEQHYRQYHVFRLMVCMIISMLVLIGAIKLWPEPGQDGPADMLYTISSPEVIQFEEITPTTQRVKPPPPPAPLPPIIVPEDEIIEEDINFEQDFLPLSEEISDVVAELVSRDPVVEPRSRPSVETAAKPVRVAEPEYTRAAERRNIRAEILVTVVVDTKGRVGNITITDRFLLGQKNSTKQRVEQLGYGLEESAVQAAQRWYFQPARVDGVPVRSEYEITFKFGI